MILVIFSRENWFLSLKNKNKHVENAVQSLKKKKDWKFCRHHRIIIQEIWTVVNMNLAFPGVRLAHPEKQKEEEIEKKN